ncbi:MAG: hypothetical protein EOM83_05235 [Clostridia bacterium]|nr:hypothetical protein [Clostridia bacterium]
MINQHLSEIESLLHRIRYQNEYLEERLVQLLRPLLEQVQKVPLQHYNDLKRICFIIAGIEKSYNFGHYFYEMLQKNNFPFGEEVLKSAVFNEPYYNLNDKALKAYVRTYLINNTFDSSLIVQYDTVIPEGHGYHFFDSFRKISQEQQPLEFIHPTLFDGLYIAANNDHFPMTQKKLAVIAAFLKLECMLPVLSGKVYKLIHQQALTGEQILVLSHYLQSIAMISGRELPAEVSQKMLRINGNHFQQELAEVFETMRPVFLKYIQTLQPIAQDVPVG